MYEVSMLDGLKFTSFFFNDTATTEIYTLSLHDALPISGADGQPQRAGPPGVHHPRARGWRSEEHTSELQSRENLVCRLLLEKKKKAAVQRFLDLPLFVSFPLIAAVHVGSLRRCVCSLDG